jgi:uridine kinase
MTGESAEEGRASKPFVVAVSGTSGGGKTTLVDKAAELLKNSVRLHFDDYVVVDNDPAVIRAWLDAGANPDEFKTPRLPDDLRTLISGEPVVLPDGGGIIEPAGFILLEEPFGRARGELAALIDFAVHLHVPADIALARRIVRSIEAQERPADEQLIEYIHRELKIYIAAGREAYVAAERAAAKSADLVLDGMRTTDDLAAELVAEIHRRRP